MYAMQRLALPIALALATLGATANTSNPPANQALEGPQAALERLASGYRTLSAEAVVATFTADYRFHAYDETMKDLFLGQTREQEGQVVQNLLHGVRKDGVRLSGGADSVGFTMNGFREDTDPEHPDSTQQYRVVTVGRVDFRIKFHDGNKIWSAPSVHVFHLVRGDVAQLVAGQPADPNRWYIRRWIENVSGIRDGLANRQGDCGEAPPPVPGPRSPVAGAPDSPTVLAVRPLANPACAALEVTCDLPGSEPARVEVYDVSGRLVNRREVPVARPGTLTIEAGAGAKLLPGIYWVRLRQATRAPSTRMVAVAR